LQDSFEKHTVVIEEKELLYRARRMSKIEYTKRKREIFSDILDGEEKKVCFHGFSKIDSFTPPISKANRANTNGNPCLYVARSMQTAIAEVRPFKQSYVSVAAIKLKRPLKLFEFYTPDSFDIYNIDWYGSLSFSFSQPFESSLDDEYLITQCISDYIRNSGAFDGLLYRSSLDTAGLNIVIYDCSYNDFKICEPVSSNVFTVTDIKVEYVKHKELNAEPVPKTVPVKIPETVPVKMPMPDTILSHSVNA
jgi:RES domain-containing protein